jgi:endonuclease YncB( thermonuclease family)
MRYRRPFERRPSAPSSRLSGALLLAALIVSGAILLQQLKPPHIAEGAVRVVDGDTLHLAGEDIRLKGIDAPELHQDCERQGRPWRCGEAAKEALVSTIAGRPVSCRIEGRDRYGRGLGRCTAGGQDLGAALVSAGFAVAFGDYEREEDAARSRTAGVWAGSFERPSAWRREHQRP